jgi:hypothetical protein
VRTASNAYFPQVLTVISLPERDDEVVQAVDRAWDTLQHVGGLEDLQNLRKILPPVEPALSGLGNDMVMEEIRSRRAACCSHPDADKPVKRAEIEVLLATKDEIGSDVPDGTFYARALSRERWEAPTAVDRVVLVHRL